MPKGVFHAEPTRRMSLTLPPRDNIEAALHFVLYADSSGGRVHYILIRLSCGEREETLIIRDDGVGIQRQLAPHSGMGLRIMNYRVA